MALDLETLKAQCGVTTDSDDDLLGRLLTSATKHVEAELGYALDDTDELPDGVPEDLENAVLQIAAHLYENREATLVGISAQALPMGAADAIANHRTYTFG